MNCATPVPVLGSLRRRAAICLLSLIAFFSAPPIEAAPVAKATLLQPVTVGHAISGALRQTGGAAPLSFAIVTPPAQGAVTLDDPATGAFTYTAPADLTRVIGGRVTFTFQVTDGSGSSAIEKVYLTVRPRYHRVKVSTNSSTISAISSWTDVVALSAYGGRATGLKANGTVVVAGTEYHGENDVGGWSDIAAVAPGGANTLGLKSDGTAVAVGYNGYGANNVGGWSGLVAVTAGDAHVVALKADGTVLAAGYNGVGQINVSGWGDIIAITAGHSHTVGLRADGTVVATGSNSEGQLDVAGWSDIVAVAAGNYHTVGIKSDGTVVAVGLSSHGELNVGAWTDVVGVAGGAFHTVGFRTDGTMLATGLNNYSQINVGAWTGMMSVTSGGVFSAGLASNVPPVAAAQTLYTDPEQPVTTADLIALASDTDGDALTLSGTSDGAHGTVVDNGDATLTYTPAAGYSGSDSFTYVVSDGANFATATITVLVSDDWDGDGLPNSWELAHGLDPHDATGDHGAAGDPDGDGLPNLWEYANNFDPSDATGVNGAAGDPDGDGLDNLAEYTGGTNPNNYAPVARRTVVRPVVAGQSVSATLLASDADGGTFTYTVVSPPALGAVTIDDAATGAFTYTVPYTASPAAPRQVTFTFQVNDGTEDSAVQTVHLTVQPRGNRAVAVGSNADGQINVAGWGNVVAVVAGGEHTLGLRADGTVLAVGKNFWGQTNVGGWSGVVAIAAGDGHSVGLKADGTVVATGFNAYGANNVGGWNGIADIAAGNLHTLGLKADGTVVATGLDDKGQLGVGGWSDVIAVTAGMYHSVGLKADGTVVAVGDNYYGQLDVSGWSDVVAVAAGNVFTVGLQADGTVVVAGSNSIGQANVGGWSDIIAVAAANGQTLGLKSDGTVVGTGYNIPGQLEVGGWSRIVAVEGGSFHSVGLQGNATPVGADVTAYANPAPGAPATTAHLPALGSDADADTLALDAFTHGAHGLVTDNGDGTLTYTPESGYEGSDSFTYRVSDGITASAAATVTVHVSTDWDGDGLPNLWEQANGLDPLAASGDDGADGDPDGDGLPNHWEYAHGFDPADASGDDGAMGDPDGDGLLNAWEYAHGLDPRDATGANGAAGDPDGDGLSNLWEQAHGFDPNDASGDNGAAGDPDGDGLSNLDEYTGGSDPNNASPVARLTVVRAVAAGESVSGTLVASDAEGDALTYTLVSQPAMGTVTLDDAATGAFTYTAPYTAEPAAHGRLSFTFRVRDGSADSTAQTAWLTLAPRGNRAVGIGGGSNESSVGEWRHLVALAAGSHHTLGLRADGTVLATGDAGSGQLAVDGWSDIAAVAVGGQHSVGLRRDGMVVATGSNASGQLDVDGWSGIVAVAAGAHHTVALRADGTAAATGHNGYGQSSVSGWSDVVAIAAGYFHSVALKADGSVVGVGDNSAGQLDVGGWGDVVAIAAGNYHTVGLKADGTLLAAGYNALGQINVGAWSDVVAIAAGSDHTLGLKADGTAVAVGNNDSFQSSVGSLSGLVALAGGADHTVGLLANIAPLASSTTLHARTGQSVATGAGSDGDGDSLSVAYLTQGGHGTVTDNGDGTVSYVSTSGFTGGDSFTYQVSDGMTTSAVATVTVLIHDPVVVMDGDGGTVPGIIEVHSGDSYTVQMSGGSGSYLASLRRPDGSTIALPFSAGTFTVSAPTTGAFAGDYLITITDVVTGATRQVTVTVPLHVDAERALLLAGDPLRSAMEVAVRGAAAGSTVTLALDGAAQGVGITLTALDDGVAQDEVDEGNAARFVLATPEDLAAAVKVQLSATVGALQGAGAVAAVPPVALRGQVAGPVAEFIDSATVTLLTARTGGVAVPWEDAMGRITAATDANGRFTLLVPPADAGEALSLEVTAAGYAAATVDAAACTELSPCLIALQSETTTVPPRFSPPAGSYQGRVLVTLESATVGATLRYTLDGTTPSATHGVEVASGTAVGITASATLKAIAYKEGLNPSVVSEAAYVIRPRESGGGLGGFSVLFLIALAGLLARRIAANQRGRYP
jgi:alpha-tubulin suppressor-like RCC1 family protein